MNSSSKAKLVLPRQLFREFWLPTLGAALWVGAGVFLGTKPPPWVAHIKDAAGCFFLVSWATGQYFRVKKQSQVETHLEGILTRLSTVTTHIEEASAQSAALLTGGDSYCAVALFNMDPVSNRGLLAIEHHGQHPLYDVEIRIVDIDELQRLAANTESLPLHSATKTLSVGTVYAGGNTAMQGWSLGTEPSPRRYNIFVRARNGEWQQQMRVINVGDRWVTASRLTPPGKAQIEWAYDDFPRHDDGTLAWF